MKLKTTINQLRALNSRLCEAIGCVFDGKSQYIQKKFFIMNIIPCPLADIESAGYPVGVRRPGFTGLVEDSYLAKILDDPTRIEKQRAFITNYVPRENFHFFFGQTMESLNSQFSASEIGKLIFKQIEDDFNQPCRDKGHRKDEKDTEYYFIALYLVCNSDCVKNVNGIKYKNKGSNRDSTKNPRFEFKKSCKIRQFHDSFSNFD